MSVSSSTKTNMNGYSQKILSAKLLRVKQLQNELTDAQFQLNELFTENRLLKTLQKRQDRALDKYESTKAALPQLIRSHNEEVRVLRAKVKQLKSECCEKDHRIKELDADLQNLRDQHHRLLKLSRDRHLGTREKLTEQMEELKEIIKEQDLRIQTLHRKVMLETKNFKHQLSYEITRHKETQRHLSEALDKISKLEILVETKEKYIANFVPKQNFRNKYRQSVVPLVSLAGPARYPDLHASMKSEAELFPQLEEESSEGTCMASHTNTTYGSARLSTEAVKINSGNHMPSDGYNTRRMKLANKRQFVLKRELYETVVNKTDDLMSSSDLTSRTPSSSVLTDDRQSDLTDDNVSKQPYSLGTAYGSRKPSLNTEPTEKLSLSVDDHDTRKSEDLEKENEDLVSSTKTSRSGSFQENGRNDLFTNVIADTREGIDVGKDSLLVLELKCVENGLKEMVSDNESRKGSLLMEKLNYAEEKSISTITNRSPGRKGSLERENTSYTEESMPAVNKILSRKGSIKTEKINFVEESAPALRNKIRSRTSSPSDEINLDTDSVKHMTTFKREKSYVSSNENGTKNDTSCEYGLAEASGHLSETSRARNKIQNEVLSERDITDTKLKQVVNNSESKAPETKDHEKKKLLAALKAIDEGEDPSVVDTGDKSSSILENALTNSTSDASSSLNISLPFIGQMRVLNKQWEGKVTSEERRTDVEKPKTKTELMQELFGGHFRDLTAGNNNSA
ncbi:lebercilin-like protein isoform X2 [Zootermopsis nevadensis]|uniref:Lebercilin-like protein n=2 Tax=Zootermopsis nevadensis TaxID=136037 RepID=A0A067QRS8_ZOONE|nr:lebercilin-like protein isoform X2 [Zootermopsis nevadensis]KDR11432.1 Lebercilin-like protein [Zootermopsis nevadensis]